MSQHINASALTARVYMINVCARCGKLILCGDRCIPCAGVRVVKNKRKRHKVKV